MMCVWRNGYISLTFVNMVCYYISKYNFLRLQTKAIDIKERTWRGTFYKGV